jgi:hypothetical protein
MPSEGVLPPAFPAPFPTNIKSLRFYATGTATAAYAGNSFAFERPDPKDPAEPEQGWCTQVQVRAIGGDMTISFDGISDHGFILDGTQTVYFDRYEGGISIKGVGTFHIEAW